VSRTPEPKLEIRSTKSEGNPKHKTRKIQTKHGGRNPGFGHFWLSVICASFGFPFDFAQGSEPVELRISIFGFPAAGSDSTCGIASSDKTM
jgi:hypothetical protein